MLLPRAPLHILLLTRLKRECRAEGMANAWRAAPGAAENATVTFSSNPKLKISVIVAWLPLHQVIGAMPMPHYTVRRDAVHPAGRGAISWKMDSMLLVGQ